MGVDVEKVIRDYLPGVIHMSLATSKDDKPWVCEVHFAFDDELNLYFRSLLSRRHSQEITANPNVAGNIVRQHRLGEMGLGVYFEGAAEVLEDVDRHHPAFRVLDGRFGLGLAALDEAANPDGHQFYKIAVKNWYVFGKLEAEGGSQKYEWQRLV